MDYTYRAYKQIQSMLRGEKICRTCKHAYTYQDQPYCDEWEEELEIEENGTCEKWTDKRGEE